MSGECEHWNCSLPIAKGKFCNAHYIRSRRGRDMDAPTRRSGDDPARFWDKVDKSGDCWNWTAYIDPAGYGRFMVSRIPQLAHRVSFERANGHIPAGMQIDHACHNPRCVNPAHLRAVTDAENKQNLAGARSDSRSGIRGVRQRESGRWSAEVGVLGQRVHLGRFGTAEEAEAAVTAWRQQNMPYSENDKKVSA